MDTCQRPDSLGPGFAVEFEADDVLDDDLAAMVIGEDGKPLRVIRSKRAGTVRA